MTAAQRALFDWYLASRWPPAQWERWLWVHYAVRRISHLTDAEARAALVAVQAGSSNGRAGV
jgi:hypothetical protein